MKKTHIILFTFLLICKTVSAQRFPVEAIMNNGSPDKYINFVVVGDGFTTSQQSFFTQKARELSGNIFQESPFLNYKNFFNTYIIKVPSPESGVTHPRTASDCTNMPAMYRNTYFKCQFDAYNIHRLLVVGNYSRLYSVLRYNFPQYSQCFILSNTEEYGGSGGEFAVSSINKSAHEIIKHELAHSFAKLTDEYWAGDFYAREAANKTKQNNRALVKWKNWLGTNDIDIYQFTETPLARSWYRPHNSCKMRHLGKPFCNVCKQEIILQILNKANFIVEYSPKNLSLNERDANNLKFELTKLMKPEPNTLEIKWTLNGKPLSFANNKEVCQLTSSMLTSTYNQLTVSVTDKTNLLRVGTNDQRIVRSVTWNITRGLRTLSLSSHEDKNSYKVFPTVTSEDINIVVETENPIPLDVYITDLNGRTVKFVDNIKANTDRYEKNVNISDLKPGTYLILFRSGNITHSQKIIKQ